MDVGWTKFHEWTAAVEIAGLWFHGINPCDQNAPTRAPVAEPEESAPLAVRVTMEQQAEQLFPVGFRYAPQGFAGFLNEANRFHQTRAR